MKKLARGFTSPLILLAIGLIVGTGIVFAYFQFKSNPTPQPQPVTTTSSPVPVTNSTPSTDDTANWKTYTSQEGKYSVKYPESVKIYVNEKMSVDGVKVPVQDTTVFVSDVLPQVKTNYQLSINHKITNETNLKDLVDNNSLCTDIQSSKAKAFILNGQQASIFENTPCGPYGMTVIYALNNGVGYIIEIETQASYSDISKFTEQILSTFKFST